MRPLMWFRADLRTRDNTALSAACAAASKGVLAVFTICPKQWREHDWGDPRVGFLRRNLIDLSKSLEGRNVALKIIERDTFDGVEADLLKLANEHDCTALFFNEEYEVNERARDARVAAAFAKAGLSIRSFHDQCVIPPGELRTQEDKPYTVYSPFKRKWYAHYNDGNAVKAQGLAKKQPEMIATPDAIPEEFGDYDPDAGRPDLRKAGEDHARARLSSFIEGRLEPYKEDRDYPAINGTSTISPYLAIGAISPRQCIEAALDANNGKLDTGGKGPVHWMSEVIWREFYRQILLAFPRVCRHQAFNPKYDIEWRTDKKAKEEFDAWCEGKTGYPIVDAAMRQLNQTGWMHNRVRMAVAMFLTKDLLIDWRWGERYFMQHLVDGDLASNNGGWQWSAATGTDAAPYFRIFNPISQSKKFDPDGKYIRTFVDELAGVDDDDIHTPWEHDGLLSEANYPERIVDHQQARQRALKAFKIEG
ncbi:MAG: deoxyribodipyrimidine photo-lyase [Phycisphaerales bacterium JB060]